MSSKQDRTPSSSAETGPPTQVLVVDDDPIIVDMLRELLEDEGFTVLTAPNGDGALYLISRMPVALVLTDFMMPNISGVELARRLRGDPRTTGIPLLLMSAAMPKVGHELFAAVIHKPFALDELVQVIRQFLPT